MDAPLLERQQELDLATAWKEKGDEEALHALTTAYMRLVISIAAKFRNYGLPFPDLVSEGNIGLMQAAARFEPEREVRFSTLRHLVDQGLYSGLRPAQLVHRTHRHHRRPEVPVLQSPPSARPDQGHEFWRADAGKPRLCGPGPARRRRRCGEDGEPSGCCGSLP